MTLEQLRVLCAIVDQGGFRAAAETLFRSQSAVSIAIRKLEEELDLKLFLRDQYRPVLTDEGRSLYDKARTVLSHAAEFSTLAQHFSMGEEPELRLAMSAVAPVELIMAVLKQVQEQAPATKLTLLVENLNGTMERLDDGDVDIAITETFTPDKSGYEHAVISQVEFVSVVSCQSAFSSRAAKLSERDMEDSTQIIVRDTSRHAGKKSVGVLTSTTPWMVNDFIMKKRIIASGMGWGRMPRHMIEDEINNAELVVLSSEDFAPITVDVNMIRPRNKPVGPVAAKLWLLMQGLEDLGS
ncbi:MAG: LysR family transcriptional regulator [Rhodospirillales bacterium]|nr:LysR family transcriptional regulator [Rhodospirillales bacterium]